MNFIVPGITLIGIGFALAACLPALAEISASVALACGFAVCGWMLIRAGCARHRGKP